MSSKTTYRFPLALLAACLFVGVMSGMHGDVFSAPESEGSSEMPRISSACLDCHDGRDTTLTGTTHHLMAEHLDGPEARVACTDCHAGDSRHWEESPTEYAMTNPSKVSAMHQAKICSRCHQNAHQQNMLEKNVHMANDVNCSACHKIHETTHPASRHEALLKTAESGLCLSCHTDVEGQFARSFRHPVHDGIVKCSECHMTLDQTARELSLNGTNACLKCHAEFAGPFPYEHQATVDYSTEEGGCLTCHEPHGSNLPRMLKQPYETPHFQLCTQCHGVPPRHNANANHGTMWAGLACNTCHTDIHGSYDSPHFLSRTLEGQGCLRSGCHQ